VNGATNGWEKRLRDVELSVAAHQERLAAQQHILERIDKNVTEVTKRQGEMREEQRGAATKIAGVIAVATVVVTVVLSIVAELVARK